MMGGGMPAGMTAGWGPPPRAGMGGMMGQTPGVPFAGIPPELIERVQKIFASEPSAEPIDVPFSHAAPAGEPPFTLGRMFAPQRVGIAFACVLIAIETITLQAGPRIAQVGIDRGLVPKKFSVVLLAAGVYLASIVLNMAISWGRIRFTGRLGQNLLYGLRVKIFGHIQRLSMDFFTEEKAGRIMTRMTSDVEALQILFEQGLVNMIVQLLTLAFVISQLFTMNVRLAAAVTLGILPALFLLTLWFRAASDHGYLAVRDRIANVLSDLQENLSGMRIVTAHNRQRYNAVKHRNVIGDHRDANIYVGHIGGVYGPGAEFVGLLAQGVVLLVGGRMVLRGTLTLGQLTAFVLYLNSFFAPIQQLVQLYSTYQQGRAATTKLRELFAARPSVAERPDAYELPPIEGEITLEDVTFGYKPAVPVLTDINLHIERGETFALVGPTGAGKSTVAKLLTRLYEPQFGRVLVDRHDISEVTIASLRRQVGVVPQEPFLFAASIGENIAFAKPDATREELIEACQAVGIWGMIEALPMGLDTPCHERGVTLSSGERQLVALARAFLAAPRVLILDEATSSLDLQTESKIERALDVLLEGRTAVLIAHRLNTAMRADRIAVVDDGGILEVGSHEQLLLCGGRYAAMYGAWIQQAAGQTA
jgi:ATP-binding cassette subfamily B protein